VLAGLSSLQALDLSGCGLAGPLPGSFAALQQLQELRLAGNALSGTLPETYALLGSLTVLDVSGNNLTGSLANLFGGSAGAAAAARAALSAADAQLQAAQRSLARLTGSGRQQQLAADIRTAELAVQAAKRSVELLKRRTRSAMQAVHAAAGPASDDGTVQVQHGAALSSLQVLAAADNALTGTLPKALADLQQLRVSREGFVQQGVVVQECMAKLVCWYVLLAEPHPVGFSLATMTSAAHSTFSN
jgi:hypothetical protein